MIVDLTACIKEERADLEVWLRGMGVNLDEQAWNLLASYLTDVESRNATVNLTADAGATLLRRHAADAFASLPPLRRALQGVRNPSIIDVGAGAGFVGVTLKIAWPEADVTLNESSRRKFQFLSWAAARLGLKGIHVVYGGAPKALGSRKYHAVLARAVAPLEDAIALAMPLVRPDDGVLLIHQSARPDFGAPSLRKALERASARVESIVPYRLPGETADRHLTLLRANRRDD